MAGGSLLRRIRSKMAISQRQFAKNAGIAYPIYNNLENDKLRLTVAMLCRIASAWDNAVVNKRVSFDKLMKLSGNESPERATLRQLNDAYDTGVPYHLTISDNDWILIQEALYGRFGL